MSLLNRSLIAVAFLIGVSVLSADGEEEKIREWTSLKGSVVTGILKEVSGETITLEINGKLLPVSLGSLSKEDRDYVASRNRIKEPASQAVVASGHLTVFEPAADWQVIDSTGADRTPEPSNNQPFRMTIHPGDTVTVNQGELKALNGESTITLVEGSSIQIPQGSETEPNPTHSLQLLKGKLFLKVNAERLKRDDREYRLKTPSAILAVKGTRFFVSTDATGFISGVSQGEIVVEFPDKEPVVVKSGRGIERAGEEEDFVERALTPQEEQDLDLYAIGEVERSPIVDRQWNWERNWTGYEDTGVVVKREANDVTVAEFPAKDDGENPLYVGMCWPATSDLRSRILGMEVCYQITGDLSLLAIGTHPAGEMSSRDVQYLRQHYKGCRVLGDTGFGGFYPADPTGGKWHTFFLPIPFSYESGGEERAANSWNVIFSQMGTGPTKPFTIRIEAPVVILAPE